MSFRSLLQSLIPSRSASNPSKPARPALAGAMLEKLEDRVLLSAVSPSMDKSAAKAYREMIMNAQAGQAVYMPLQDNQSSFSLLSAGDDLPVVLIRSEDAPAGEYRPGRNENAWFKVTRKGKSDSLEVKLAVGGSATPIEDYTFSGAELRGDGYLYVTVPAGQWTTKFQINAVDDAIVEDVETVELTIAASENYAIGRHGSATRRIFDNDVQLNSFTVTDQSDSGNAVTAGTQEEIQHLYVAEREQTQDSAVLLSADFLPAEFADKVRWMATGAVVSPQTSGSFAAGTQELILTPTGSSRTYTLTAWADNQFNGVLDAGEESRQVMVHVIKADLVLDGLPEESEPTPNELDPGAFILLNNDDDDGNGVLDLEDTGTVSGEDDLVAMQLSVLGLTSGTATLSIASGADKVNVWLNADKSGGSILGGSVTQKTWDLGQQPGTVYVEAIGGSLVAGDISFTLAAGPPSAPPATDTVTGTSYAISLAHNGNNVTGIKAGDVLIGQKIDVQLVVVSPWLTNNIQWTVAGDTFKDYTATADAAVLTPLAADDLNDQSVVFYWADAGANNPSSKSVDVTLTLNGRQYTRSTRFDVYEPTADVRTEKGEVRTGDDSLGFYGLVQGENDPNIAYWGGFEMYAKVEVPNIFAPGQWAAVQLIESRRTRTLSDGTLQKNGKYGDRVLDGIGFPTYPGSDSAWDTGATYQREADSPSTGGLNAIIQHNGQPTIITHTSAADEFDLYIMFKPAGNGNVWVPLKKLHWHWRGEATRQGNGWTLDPLSDDAAILPAENWNEHPLWSDRFFGDTFVDA